MGDVMGIESWLILLLIMVAFVILMVFVIKTEDAAYYYQCYNQSVYKRRAFYGVCKSISGAEKCKECPYYKRFRKEVLHENKRRNSGKPED